MIFIHIQFYRWSCEVFAVFVWPPNTTHHMLSMQSPSSTIKDSFQIDSGMWEFENFFPPCRNMWFCFDTGNVNKVFSPLLISRVVWYWAMSSITRLSSWGPDCQERLSGCSNTTVSPPPLSFEHKVVVCLPHSIIRNVSQFTHILGASRLFLLLIKHWWLHYAMFCRGLSVNEMIQFFLYSFQTGAAVRNSLFSVR